MKTTIKDIANAAGVSPASVSLVLNNRPSRISDRTRQKILDTADQLGYHIGSPNKGTKARPRSRVIGVILSGIDNAYATEYLLGIEKYAGIYDYRMVSCDLGFNSAKCISYIEFLWNTGVDGIIMIPPDDMNQMENNRKLGEALRSSGQPFVLLSRAIDRVFTDFVTSDFKAGAYAATEHLILNGHERIGIVTGNPEIYNTRKKLEGYKEAMIFYGFSLDNSLIFTGDHTPDSGYKAAGYLIEQGATAILSMNDWMAFGIYRYADDHHIAIGEDLSVISFNNSRLCDYLTPPLTSINEEYELLGRKACERLLIRIREEDPDGPKNSYFIPTLVERKSVRKQGRL